MTPPAHDNKDPMCPRLGGEVPGCADYRILAWRLLIPAGRFHFRSTQVNCRGYDCAGFLQGNVLPAQKEP